MRIPLEERVRIFAAEELRRKGHVTFVDTLRDMGLLDNSHYFDWIDLRVSSLEGALSANPSTVDEALNAFCSWAESMDLKSRAAEHFSATRHPLRLLLSEDDARSQKIGVRYFSQDASDEQIARIQEQESRPPELAVFEVYRDTECSRCGVAILKSALVFVESEKPLCMKCAEFDDFVFLRAGDRTLSRRARNFSAVSALVLRYSGARKRYERQGLLVTKEAVDHAEAEASSVRSASRAKAKDLSAGGAGQKIYQLKITLLDIEPSIWRRMLVPASIDLGRLHRVIQRAMGWSNSHSHEFQFKSKRLSPDEHLREFFLPRPTPKPITLEAAVPTPGSKFLYVYDPGDEWEHEILVERIFENDGSTHLPICLEGQRACPPEDCGGSLGYVDLLDAMADADNPESAELLEWLGDDFDPELFDVEAVNRALKRIKC